MRARGLRAAAALLGLAACLCDGAAAEQLLRLHVTALTLATDIARPNVDQTFHLIVALHVRERNVVFDTVQLPSFNGLDELGDERSTVSAAHGTDYRETLSLVAHAPGRYQVSPASFDAIDAVDGKPKRFISNALTIVVGNSLSSSATSIARALRLLFVLLLALTIPLLAWLVFARTRSLPVLIAPPSAPPDLPARTIDDDLRAALRRLRERPDRPSALFARSVLRRAAGADDGETLVDVLRRPPAREPRLRALLRSAERAAFVQDEYLPEAIAHLVAEMERIP